MSSEERRAKNAERQRSWRARNPERANAIAAAGRQRNRAKVAASWKAYYEKNEAELYKKKKAYFGRNGEKLSQWKRADYMCAHQSAWNDHIIPVSKGGSSTARNIELLCESCNRAKQAEIH